MGIRLCHFQNQKQTYDVVLRLPPIEALDNHRQHIAGCEYVYNQCMLSHPLHHHTHAPPSVHINLHTANQ